MQFSLDLNNKNEKTIDEIAYGFWAKQDKVLTETGAWPTHSLLLKSELHSGAEFAAQNWAKSAKNRHVFNAFNEFSETELLSLLVQAERNEIFLLVLCDTNPNQLKLSSADLRSRVANLTILEGLQPCKEVLHKMFRKWCQYYGVEIPKNIEKMILSEHIFDFVTLYKSVCIIKASYAPGSKLSQDDMVGIIMELERDNKFL